MTGIPIIRVTLPDTVTLVSFDELRPILKSADDPRYPTKVTLYCDECGVRLSVEIIVTDAVPGPQRLEMGRAYLRTLGWQADEEGDFCPVDRTPEGEGQ
jgi:hypothetical protein